LNQDDLGRRIRDSITDYVNENAGSVGENVSRFARFGLRLANFLVTVVVGLMLGLYFLLSMPRIGATFTRVVPADKRAELAPISARMRDVFTGYLRARLIVSLVVGGLAIFGMWAVGMPFWLILGVIVGVTNLIPMIGSFIGGVPVVIVALLTKPPIFIFVALVVLVVAHAVDGYILSPIVLRTTTNLHPIVVLLAVIIGGALLGLWGIIAAVPIAGGIQVVVLELLRRRRLEAEPDAFERSPA
jgi:predicted PurR-regulated permease PerM